MSPALINSEIICDRQGLPLTQASSTLLKALDKLLTVGAYYSAEHGQYLLAARQARDAIVGAIGGPGSHAAIEITAQGLLIGGQNLDPRHRNVHLLHDLLVPLNIARLEIDGSLSPEELRQALAALQRHKATLGQSHSFQEVVIEDLPDTVRAVSCSVLRRAETGADTGGDGDSDASSLDALLGKWDEQSGAGGPKPPEQNTASLAQEFLDLLARILANLEALVGEAGLPGTAGADGSYVTVADLMELRQTLENLVAVNPDPAELAQLIAQAQQALGLSRDARSVDLVFQILKKDVNKSQPTVPSTTNRKPTPVKFNFSVAQLQSLVAELAAKPTPVPLPGPGASANQLGIGLHLLRADPPRALRSALLESVAAVVARPDFAEQYLELYTQAAATVVNEENEDAVDELLPQFTVILRQSHPASIAFFWARLLDETDADQLATIWPHLVNDLLLGLNHAPREITMRLALAAGGLTVPAATTMGRRLDRQPALQGQSAARDLFLAPLTEIQIVLTVLLASPLQAWLGEEIFRALRQKPLSRLVDLVTAALGEHDSQNNDFYLELIRHGRDADPPASLREPALDLLGARLAGLAPAERNADWVPFCLSELARLDPDRTRPLLERVQNQKKLFFFKAWPAAARQAATRALTATDKEVPVDGTAIQ